MFAQNRQTLDTNFLRQRFKLHSFNSELNLRKTHPEADSFFQNVKLRPGKIREHAAKLFSSGVLAGSLLLPPTPAISLPPITEATRQMQNVPADSPVMTQLDISLRLKEILSPVGQWQLSSDQENKIGNLLQEKLGIKATAELDGNRLNFNFGRMGAEQHLPRFPGDSAEQHGAFIDKGITPGLGGWGYVSDSEVEKWYVAVPIIYLPDWQKQVKYYVDWYKYRRVVVVNPANGKTVIGAVADAGPADWTGKHFGGSPEVLNYLGIDYGMQNHPVVMFFLDDPNKEVPLGPLEYNIEKNKKELINKT